MRKISNDSIFVFIDFNGFYRNILGFQCIFVNNTLIRLIFIDGFFITMIVFFGYQI